MFDAIKGYFVSFLKEKKAKDYLVSLFKGSRAKHKGEKVFLTINGLCSLYHKVFHLKNSEKVKNFTVDRVLPLL